MNTNSQPLQMAPTLIPPGAGQVLAFLGVTHKLTRTHTGGAYYLFEGRFEPQSGNSLHVHRNEDEMVHVLEGELEVRVAGETLHAGAGGIVHLPRNIPHALYNPGETPVLFMALAVPGGMEDLFDELAAAQAAGTLTPESHRDISLKYGLEWLE